MNFKVKQLNEHGVYEWTTPYSFYSLVSAQMYCKSINPEYKPKIFCVLQEPHVIHVGPKCRYQQVAQLA